MAGTLRTRIAITLLLPALVLLARWVPPAGFDVEVLRATDGWTFSVLHLGVGAALGAFVLVEIAAMIVPPWRGLRHENPQGRRKLERAVRVVFVVLVLLQTMGALGAARAVDGALSGTLSEIVFSASLMGGAFTLFLLAEWVTRQGLVNGFLVAQTVLVAADVARVLAGPAWYLSRVYIGIVLVLFATVSSLATWVAVRKLGPSDLAGTEPTGTPYRGSAKEQPAWAPVIPTPTSSLQPYMLATAGVAAIGQWGPRFSAPVRFALALVIAVALARFVGRLLQRPADVAAVLLRLGATEPRAVLEDQARARLVAAERSTWLYFAALLIAAALAEMTRANLPVGMVPVGVALALDLRAAIRERRADDVCVWEERRTHAAMAIVQALGNQGIRATATGVATQSLLQIFAPFAPITLWVAPADAEQARTFLAARLGTEKGSPERDAHERVARVPAGWAPTKRFRALLTVVATLAAVGFLLAVSDGLERPRTLETRPRVTLEVVEVDDSFKLDVSESALPEGASFVQSHYATGSGTVLRFAVRNGETATPARERASMWLRTQSVPEGCRFALEDVTDADSPTIIALQTVLLRGAPILTGRDIAQASATPGWEEQPASVGLTLTPEGAARFEEATARLVRHRFAILTDGVVRSVPVVRDKVSGGHVSISMGAGSHDEQLESAKRLAAALGGD